jgi:hypothetical protein
LEPHEEPQFAGFLDRVILMGEPKSAIPDVHGFLGNEPCSQICDHHSFAGILACLETLHPTFCSFGLRNRARRNAKDNTRSWSSRTDEQITRTILSLCFPLDRHNCGLSNRENTGMKSRDWDWFAHASGAG